MPSTRSLPLRFLAFLSCAVFALVALGCDSGNSPNRSPTAPAPPSAGQTVIPVSFQLFRGESVVLSVTGAVNCGGNDGPRAGDVWRDMRWDEVEATLPDGSWLIAYNAEWVNGPDDPRYSGTLAGRRFADTFTAPGYSSSESCSFRESSLAGEFSQDSRSFEAVEIQISGPPGREYRLEVLHRAARP